VDTLKESVVQLLVESGCREVLVGAESGSDVMLRAMRKGQSAIEVKQAIRRCKDAGIKVIAYFLVGFPGETWETLRETFELIRESSPDELHLHTPVPYPGTDLYNNPQRYGITWMSPNFNDYSLNIRMDQRWILTHPTSDNTQEMYSWIVAKLSREGFKCSTDQSFTTGTTL